MLNYRHAKLTVILIVSFFLVFSPLSSGVIAGGHEDLGKKSPGNMVIDAVFYRTFGLVAIPVGTAIFVVMSPFSALGGNFKESFEKLVVTPTKFTFQRPLGDI